MNTRTLHPDLEYFMGKMEPPYEFRGQATIGRMLDRYNIPFFYKQPLLLWENQRRIIRRPDFTLPTYNNTVIEYILKPDLSTGRAKRLYKENNIAALFLVLLPKAHRSEGGL